MNGVLKHPTGERLNAFSLGQLNDDELVEIEGHLESCSACREAAENAADDTLVALLRSAATEPTSAAEPCPASATQTHPGSALPAAAGLTVPPALADHPRYRLLELLGVGGMGAVYKAEHLLMRRLVALKVVNPELVPRPATVERFQREARAAAQLVHPNIVTAFDAEQAGDAHYLVMEHVEGLSLARLVAERGPLPVREACAYIRQAATGLQHAHERGMVHRDIKPQNLMLTPGGQIKVLDFGLARFAMENAPALLSAAEEEQAHRLRSGSPAALTQHGVVMGTPDYIAPEQARDSHNADIRADIYSLGCTLYHLLAGQPPFPEGTALEKVKAHLEESPPPLAELRPDLPDALVCLVGRMMAKNPAERWQTPGEVATALAPFEGAPGKPLGRRKWPAAVAAALAAILLAGTVIYVQTDTGKLIIEINDNQIAVAIQNAAVKIIDKANGREYTLVPGERDVRAGEYRIQVTDAVAGLEFSPAEFRLTRGGTRTVRVTARFEGNDAVGRLDAAAFAWFPSDCTFFGGRDFRAQAGLSEQQLLVIFQLLAETRLKDQIWKFKSLVGRIDRITSAYAPNPTHPGRSRYFLRVSGQIDSRRIEDAYRHEFPIATAEERLPKGKRTILLSTRTPAIPAIALVDDTDLVIAGYLGEDGDAIEAVGEMLDVKEGKRSSAEARVRSLLPEAPPQAWGLIMGEIPELFRHALTSGGTPFRDLPDRVVLSLHGDKDLLLRLDGAFQVGSLGPRRRRLPSQAEADARTFEQNLRILQIRMIAFIRSAAETYKVPPETANLAVHMWQSLRFETLQNRVTAEMHMEPKATDALLDGLRAVPLSSISSLWPMFQKLLQPDRRTSAAKKRAEERVAILKKMVTDNEARYAAGSLGHEEMLEARTQLKKAELDLCDTPEERVKVYAALLALAREVENTRDKLFKAGACPASALAEAHMRVLDAEDAYEKAKSQSPPKDR
ncbi:MAG TPA: protein kinase [Gemmataceae bacterium]|jgi:hypothetical protein|nr:protein kinase [Gemmataceae bacterium]